MSIIGINGYIGAGKDTVGHIIQYLTAKNGSWLVDFGDKNFDSDFKFIEKSWGKPPSTWEIKKFAAKLKQVASILTGIPVEKFENQEFKKTFLSSEWNYLGPSCDGGKYGVSTMDIGEQKMSARLLLQKLGTEAIRDGLHTNAWVNALFADYQVVEDLNGKGFQIANWNDYPNWIITDCRFPNEAQAIEGRGGFVVRVNRGESVSNHPSETSLDNWEFDYVIENHSHIIDLTQKVSEMLRYFKIIS